MADHTNFEEQETEESDSQEEDKSTSTHGRSVRNHHPPAWMQSGDFVVENQSKENLAQVMSVNVDSVGVEPKTVQEALNSPSATLW